VHPAYPHACNLAPVQAICSCTSFWRFLLRAFLGDTRPYYWAAGGHLNRGCQEGAADIQAKALMDAAIASAQGQAAAAKELTTESTVDTQTRADVERERMNMKRQSAAE
jgi:hypothetical protein